MSRTTAVILAAAFVLGPTAALAGAPKACTDYDRKISSQYAGAIQKAQASGSACQKTALQVKLMEAALAAPTECGSAGDRSKLKAAIAQSRQSLKDQGCP
jgi:hypothetical protein